ncbi:MAG: NAD-dependent epimerase/dehydratase family protein, partial [Planctomycetota bacterium]
MTRRVLITGATGFIGQHLLPRLAEVFDEVHAIARALPAEVAASSAKWHQYDLMQDDPAGLMQQAKPTHLIHLAWITTPGEYWTSPSNTEWLERSKALFDAFIVAGGQRIVGLGTCAEYDWSAGVCKEQTTPIAPASIYGQSKVELHAYLTSQPIASAWARVFWPYG